MSSASATTNWELRLKDFVLSPLKRIAEFANVAQNKINGVQKGLNNAASASNVMGRDLKRNYGQLEDLLKNLETRQKQAFSTKHIQAYQRMIDKTKAEMMSLENVTKPQMGLFAQLRNSMKDGAAQLGVPGIGAVGKAALLTGAVVGVGMALKSSVNIAAEYEKGMAKINATAQLGADSLGKLKSRLKEIGSQSGGNFEIIPEAYEKILSQTGKVNLSLDILEESVKGAQAGFTQIDVVAGALAQTLSSVGEGNADAKQILDTFMKAKALGAGEFSDFATYMPSLIASGKNLSIVYQDVAGLFSYMTAKGNSAANSAMLLQNAFTALSKKDVIEGLTKKGINLFDANGMRRNIKDVFLELSAKLSKMSDLGRTKFLLDIGLNDAQARQAFSVLTDEASKFKNIMEGVNNAVGETDRQLEMTQNRMRDWGNVADNLKDIGESIGSFLLPIVDTLIEGLHGVVRGIKEIAVGVANIFTGKAFQDDAAYKAEKDRANAIASMGAAQDVFKKKYGFDIGDHSHKISKEQQDFYNTAFNKISSGLKTPDGKNVIDKNEKSSAAEKALNNVNKGGSVDGSKDKTEKTEGNISGNAPRILTMNLDIKNYINGKGEIDEDRLYHKIMDQIVDAARDGLATVGA